MRPSFISYSAPVTAVALALAVSACAAPPAEFVPAERACYRTLGRVDCHAPPLIGEAGRRVGAFDWAALETAASP